MKVKAGTRELLDTISLIAHAVDEIECTIGDASESLRLLFVFRPTTVVPPGPGTLDLTPIGPTAARIDLINWERTALPTVADVEAPIGSFANRELFMELATAWIGDSENNKGRWLITASFYLGQPVQRGGK